jgi:CpeS-like protein
MDIQEFFDLWSGKWVSQRSVHDLRSQQNQSTRSDLWIEKIDRDGSPVTQLCQSLQQDPAQVDWAFQIRWTEAAEQSSFRKSNKEGSTILVILKTTPTGDGNLLRQNHDGTTSTGSYRFGEDEVLTMVTALQDYQFSERFWFASPNLRMRNTLIQQGDVTHLATFCTEIRMGGAPAAPAAEQTMAQTPT